MISVNNIVLCEELTMVRTVVVEKISFSQVPKEDIFLYSLKY